MVDARGIGGNGSSSGVGVAGSNGHWGSRSNSNRSSRGDRNRSSRGDRNRSDSNGGSSASNRATSRDDKEVGSRGVAMGDGLVLSGNGLRSKRTSVADSVAIPESSRVPARLRLAVPVF